MKHFIKYNIILFSLKKSLLFNRKHDLQTHAFVLLHFQKDYTYIVYIYTYIKRKCCIYNIQSSALSSTQIKLEHFVEYSSYI